MSTDIYLILENGIRFKGTSFGAEIDKDIIGEVVFTTGMTGYVETLTDKSYAGQIIVQTFPLIGNYGVSPDDFETQTANKNDQRIFAKGYIVHDYCDMPSNFRSQGTLASLLKEQGIPAITGIDTRALVKILREHGVMNGIITKNGNADLKAVSQFVIKDSVTSVSTKEPLLFKAKNAAAGTAQKPYSVCLIDYGYKQNIVRSLCSRGCDVTVLPCTVTAAEIKAHNPDGIMLSNGPGDPKENEERIQELKRIASLTIPIFGICLGHQLLALANGCRTEKLKYGHRGTNQPVKETATGRIYMSSQNHGYAVVSESITAETAAESFVNVNDNTCEGILYKTIPSFSVQFHPEACGGPHDTSFLFDRFVSMMKSSRQKNI